jgi:hypothetical protein
VDFGSYIKIEPESIKVWAQAQQIAIFLQKGDTMKKIITFVIFTVITGLAMGYFTNIIESTSLEFLICWLVALAIAVCSFLGICLYKWFENLDSVSSRLALLFGVLSGFVGIIFYKVTYTQYSPPVTEPVVSFFMYLGIFLMASIFGSISTLGILNKPERKKNNTDKSEDQEK